MVCTLFGQKDVKTFNSHVEPRAVGECFQGKVWNILTSFLWSIRVQTMEIVVDFFYNNIDSLLRPFPLKFLGKSGKIVFVRKRGT